MKICPWESKKRYSPKGHGMQRVFNQLIFVFIPDVLTFKKFVGLISYYLLTFPKFDLAILV